MDISIVDDKRWTTTMDPPADQAAADIIKNGGIEALGDALDLLSNQPPDKPAPAGLEAFIDRASLPKDVDQARINVAQDWFTRWTAIGTASLYCASLPETYCLPGIAQLLLISHQLTSHVTRRIRMTGQMLFDVMTPGGITERSLAVRSLRRTRLMHAALRWMRLNPDLTVRSTAGPGDRPALIWTDRFGQPINQLELVYTLMTFSHVVLRSADLLGIVSDDTTCDAYNYAWNVAGHVLGIDPGLLPGTRDEAAQLFDRIKSTQARAIEGTPRLIAALEESWRRLFAQHHWPLAQALMHALFNALLTPDTRHLLGITESGLLEAEATLLAPVLKGAVHLAEDTFTVLPASARLAVAVNHYFAMREVGAAEDDSLYNSARHIHAWYEQVRTLRTGS